MTHITKALLGLALLLVPAEANAASRGTNVGVLECSVSPGLGMIIGSTRSLDCRYKPTRGPSQHYRGTINRLGLDVGFTGRGRLGWIVVAPGRLAPGALAGSYAGGSGDVSLGIGVGANALIGGSKRSIALQPFSIEGKTGINLALGVASLRLRAVR